MAARTRPLIVLSAVAAAAFSLFAAGCGGSGSPGVASVGSSPTTTANQTGLLAYSRCMRSHGVPSFPDPGGKGGIPKPQVVAAAQSNPHKFNAADGSCHHLAPAGLAAPETAQQQRAQLADELSFAKCMRSHGVTNFPDPSAHGGLTVAMVEAQGIDVRSPAVLRIVQRCLPASHGALTMAKVNEALRDAGG
jgi:hypothetical protein